MPDTHPDPKIAKLLAERDAARVACSAAVKERDEAVESLASRDDIIADLARRLRLTKEEVEYLRKRIFGRKSEKLPPGPTLFDLAVPAPDGEAAGRSLLICRACAWKCRSRTTSASAPHVAKIACGIGRSGAPGCATPSSPQRHA